MNDLKNIFRMRADLIKNNIEEAKEILTDYLYKLKPLSKNDTVQNRKNTG